MSRVIFTVELKVKEEFKDIAYPYMQAMHKLTHEFDKGIIQYDLFTHKEDKCKFYFIEEWESEELFEEHRLKDHYKTFGAFIKDKLEYADKKPEKIDTNSLEKYEEMI